jgi:hypothetical protein
MYLNFLRLLTCVCFLTLVLPAFGQTARFSGEITDQQGAVLSDATVQVVNQDTLVQRETKTDGSGFYTVAYLNAGKYQVVVHATGFNTKISNDMQLSVGQALLYNVQLTVGSAQSTVSVSAGSEVTQIHTENAEVSGTITGKEVTSIGLNGRNFSQFIALAPGVSNQTSQDEARVGMAGSVSYSVNGGRTEYNSFQVDGSETLNVGINKDHTSLIVTPSIDAIQEIKVLTSNYGAMYPSTGNGTTIITTKSGTDQFHGNLYEFFRNEIFNAKGYFDVGNRAPLYRRNDFGGTIGGPVVLPHFYDGRGKTHFFFSEEVRLETDPYAYRQAVPSFAERNGDFSDVCPANGGALTRTQYPDCPQSGNTGTALTPFPGNSLRGSGTLNRNALAILGTGIIPFPNATSGCNSTTGSCYNTDVSLPTYWREELFRIDHALSQKVQLGFRYIHDEWDETTPVPQYGFVQNSVPTIQNRFYGPGTSLAGRLTSSLSSTLLNEVVAGYTNSHLTLADRGGAGVNLQRPAALDAPCASDPFSPTVYQCPIGAIFLNGNAGTDGVAKMPGIAIAGNNGEYGGVGFNTDTSYMPWEHSNPTYSFADNITKIIGKHNLQFGAQWVIYQRNQINGPIGAATGDTQGLLTFSNVKGSHSTGNAFADFLFINTGLIGNTDPNSIQGAISSFQQDSAQGRYHQRYQNVEPYLQDDFKATSRLTINLGIRLSLFGTFHELGDNAYNWLPSAFSSTVASSFSIGSNTSSNYYGALIDKVSGNPIRINQTNPGSSADISRITNGIVQCGKNGVPSSCMSGHLLNPAPRIGLAWDPQGNGKTAIRAGYGMFFEHGTADEANTGSLEGSAPMVLDMTQNNPRSWNSIGSGYAFPINVTQIPTKAVWPYVQQWSLSVERELPKNMLATFGYVGSKGTHLTAVRQINQLQPLAAAQNPFGLHEPLHYAGVNPLNGSATGDCNANAGNAPTYLENGTRYTPASPFYINLQAACFGSPGTSGIADPNTFRPYLGLGQIYSLENIATSTYNAFQATLRRTQGPLNLGVAYTYSHSFDDASDRSDATFVNSYDLKSNRASSNFDQRHLLHISYVYQLPLLHFMDTFLHSTDDDPTNELIHHSGQPASPQQGWQARKVVQSILGGWELSGITLFESGIPFTVVNGGSPQGVGTLDNAGVANGTGSGSYPDLSGISVHSARPVGGNNSKSVGPLLLNPAAFAAPRGLTFGNAGRNVLNNPRRWNTDASLLKHIAMPHETELQFRAEAFNLFNATQFRIFDPILGNQAQNTVSCYGDFAANYSAAGGDGTDCLTGNSFLHPVDAHRPRTIQFGLKLAF